MAEDMLTWLRCEIVAEKEASEAAGGEEWIIGTDGQQLFLAPANAETRPWNAERIAEWTYPVAPWQPGEWEECDRSKPFHIARHDPRDTIARCEADLVELDVIEAIPHERVRDDEWFSCSQARDEHGELSCYDDSRVGEPCDCGRNALVNRLIRAKAYGRRHRPGWHPGWAPEEMAP